MQVHVLRDMDHGEARYCLTVGLMLPSTLSDQVPHLVEVHTPYSVGVHRNARGRRCTAGSGLSVLSFGETPWSKDSIACVFIDDVPSWAATLQAAIPKSTH